ncbi:MAG TPA: hypothetical protein DEF05_01145 [Erwinia sp.]|uniref:YccT family protein n=1 Tax=Erwinia citreus TaxID=558 RepID=UPI000E890785|nr:DUF2057 family protein [Erwinia sp.]HBV38314.1 hypothetical protein [Erwinia sp.]
MKLGLLLTGLMAMWVADAAQATTLKLAPDVDLLVLDGHKISGSLLKGADGLELEQGQHQLLFRVEKNLETSPASSWQSPPLIVTFTTSAKSIAIALPPIHTSVQARAFARRPDFQLHDEHGNVVQSQRDRLTGTAGENYEREMAVYNMQGHSASVPRFAQPHPVGSSSGNRLTFASSNYPAGRVLQLWYQQVDAATRQRFVLLMKAWRTG